MQTTGNIYRLTGKIMQYAWGGTTFLPDLLQVDNPDHRPFAEYWMGAHPLGPAELDTPSGKISLDELIRQNPVAVLSQKVVERFGELPYLFKLQDVKDILSIQVHPSKEAAETGFEREETEGISRNAPHRNYKDRNHKPEVMVALSEFWLLHGFRQHAEIEAVLAEIPEFNVLSPYFKREGLKALYQFVMEMEQAEINALLLNLVKREIRRKKDGQLSKEMPGWWVAKLYDNKGAISDIDKAVFSVYFFNIVKLNPGEAVFQGAGLPHTYMEGQCVELMANSDNVLRGGLTPKHIDVPELIKNTSFESLVPDIMKGVPGQTGEKIYPCPVPDFGVASVELTPGMSYNGHARSLEIVIITEGGAVINNSLVLKRGKAAAIFAGEEYQVEASGHCVFFRAFVPVE